MWFFIESIYPSKFQIILLVALTYGIIFSFHEIQASSQDLKGFDPYEILGV